MPLVDANLLNFQYPEQSRAIPAGHEALFKRAAALEPRERLLLELAFKENLSVRQIAKIFERPAGTISRQLQRLCARLRDPIVAALLEPQCVLAPQIRALAIAYFAQGKRLEDLAREHDLTRTRVRNVLHFVRGWYRGVHLNAQAV